MPGRFSQATELEVLKNRFGFSAGGIVLNPRYNVAQGFFTYALVRFSLTIPTYNLT